MTGVDVEAEARGEAVSDVVARAKSALEGVTGGPWDWFSADQCCGGTCVDNGHGLPLHSGGDLLPRDARFIAAARSLLPELVAEVENLRRENEALIKRVIGDEERWAELLHTRAELARVEAELERVKGERL